jgi:hypothetical protein
MQPPAGSGVVAGSSIRKTSSVQIDGKKSRNAASVRVAHKSPAGSHATILRQNIVFFFLNIGFHIATNNSYQLSLLFA